MRLELTVFLILSCVLGVHSEQKCKIDGRGFYLSSENELTVRWWQSSELKISDCSSENVTVTLQSDCSASDCPEIIPVTANFKERKIKISTSLTPCAKYNYTLSGIELENQKKTKSFTARNIESVEITIDNGNDSNSIEIKWGEKAQLCGNSYNFEVNGTIIEPSPDSSKFSRQLNEMKFCENYALKLYRESGEEKIILKEKTYEHWPEEIYKSLKIENLKVTSASETVISFSAPTAREKCVDSYQVNFQSVNDTRTEIMENLSESFILYACANYTVDVVVVSRQNKPGETTSTSFTVSQRGKNCRTKFG